MAEFKRGPQTSRHIVEKLGQQRRVLFEVGRQLEQHRPKFRFQVADDLAEVAHRVPAIPELREMRHLLWRFQAELETVRRSGPPILDRLRTRNSPKGVVHFGGAETL